jgi:hypothetical protein
VIEIPQQLHLAQRPQAEHGVVEGSNFLDGDFLPGGLMDCGAASQSDHRGLERQHNPGLDLPHHSVGTFTDNILNVILLAHVERNLSGPAPVLRVAHGCSQILDFK